MDPSGQRRDHGKDATIVPKFGSHAQSLASHQSSYFYSEWSKKWIYGTCMDDQPPLPPDELQVRPESHRKRIVVTFRLPENHQRDILSMRLFRKLQDEHGRDLTDWLPMVHSDGKVDQAPANVIFYDRDVDFFQISKRRYVYAAQCVSRHGEDSVLSTQLAARLNKDYSSRGEFLVDCVSAQGVRLEYFGAFSVIPFQTTKVETIAQSPPQKIGQNPGVAAIVLTGRDTISGAQSVSGVYLLRVQSLDTGETSDIPFNLTFQFFKTREKFVPQTILTLFEPDKRNSVSVQSKTPMVLQKLLSQYEDPKKLSIQKDDVLKPLDLARPGDRWRR